MADISDVEQAIVDFIDSVVYPNGDSSPSVLLDQNGNPAQVKIYRGWPTSANLDADVAASNTQPATPAVQKTVVNISIFPTPVEINATRYTQDYDTLLIPQATLTLANNSGPLQLEGGGGDILLEGAGAGPLNLEGDVNVLINGTVSVPQNVALIINKTPFVYAVQANDTLNSIAAALQAMINPFFTCTVAANILTIPSSYQITMRTGVVATAIKEVARQKRQMQISIWTNTPLTRDNAGKLIDPQLKSTNFLDLVDGTKARIIYERSPVSDDAEKQGIYRRNLIYSAEYGTTITVQAPTVTIQIVNLNAQGLLQEDDGAILLEDGGELYLEGNSLYY